MANRRWPLWVRVTIAALILGILLAPVIVWREQIVGIFEQRERAAAIIRGGGAWGPLMIIGLTVAQIMIAPIPGQVVNFVAGYVFGFWLGALWSWLGTVLGSSLAMMLARWAGRPLVKRLVSPGLLGRLDRAATGRGLWFFFLVFLLPGLPDDAACFLAGLTPLPLPVLIAIVAVGRIPGVAAATWAGAYAERMPWQGWFVMGGLVIAAALVARRYGVRIQDALLRWLARRS